MTEWPYEQIDTHVEDALGRFTSQYDDMPMMQGIARVWAERMQAMEGDTYDLLTQRWLNEAAGEQLDRLGATVGEPRLGRTDDPYRDAIQVRITINWGSGEPETIIEFLRRIAGAEQIIYRELYPANIEVFVRGNVSVQNALRVKDIIPAGVGIVYISESGGFVPFGHSETAIVPYLLETDASELYQFDSLEPWGVLSFEPAFFDDIDGFGELGFHTLELSDGGTLELSSGGLLGVTDQDDPILPTQGGVLAELYEV